MHGQFNCYTVMFISTFSHVRLSLDNKRLLTYLLTYSNNNKKHVQIVRCRNQSEQESRAVARKPRDAAAVLFGLKVTDNIHYKFKSSKASKDRLPAVLQTYVHKTEFKTEFNAKWPFKFIQDRVLELEER